MNKRTTAGVFVEDQANALAFYNDTLGLVKKTDVPGVEHRWLTVVSPAVPDGVELLLGPSDHPAATVFNDTFVERITATLSDDCGSLVQIASVK